MGFRHLAPAYHPIPAFSRRGRRGTFRAQAMIRDGDMTQIMNDVERNRRTLSGT
jgi:hypothetical protein